MGCPDGPISAALKIYDKLKTLIALAKDSHYMSNEFGVHFSFFKQPQSRRMKTGKYFFNPLPMEIKSCVACAENKNDWNRMQTT